MTPKIPAHQLLGKKHKSYRFNVLGGLNHMISRRDDRQHFLTQLRDALVDIARSFYTGDLHAVDKGLQTCCLDADRPEQPEDQATDNLVGPHEAEPIGEIALDLHLDGPSTMYAELYDNKAKHLRPGMKLYTGAPQESAAESINDAYERGRQAAYDQMKHLISQAADATIYCMENSIGKIGEDSIPALIKDHQRLRALAQPPVIIDAADLTPEQVELLREARRKITPITEAIKEGPRWPRLRGGDTASVERAATSNVEAES